MIRRPPRSTRTDTLFPYTTLFRSRSGLRGVLAAVVLLLVVSLVAGQPQKASPYVYARERPNGAVRLVLVLGLARDRADVTLGLLAAEHEVLAPLHHVLAQVLSAGRPSLRGLAPRDLLEGRLDRKSTSLHSRQSCAPLLPAYD